MRLTWKRHRERWYRDTHDLSLNGTRVATVQEVDTEGGGFFWYAGDEGAGIPFRNTYRAPKSTLDEAKAEAMAYVRMCLEATRPG